MSLYKCLNNIPSSPPIQPLEAARPLLKKGISVPYSIPLPSEDSNWKVAFEPPSNITLVGSWNNKTSVKGMDGRSWGVDIAVEMPDVSLPIRCIKSVLMSSRVSSKKRII